MAGECKGAPWHLSSFAFHHACTIQMYNATTAVPQHLRNVQKIKAINRNDYTGFPVELDNKQDLDQVQFQPACPFTCHALVGLCCRNFGENKRQ